MGLFRVNAHVVISVVMLASNATARTDLPNSKPLLEQRALELKQDLRALSDLRTELNSTREQLSSAAACLKPITPPSDATAQARTAKLTEAWNAFKTADPNATVAPKSSQLDALDSAAKDVLQLLPSVKSCISGIPRPRRDPFTLFMSADSSESPPSPKQTVAQIVAQAGKDELDDFVPKLLPELLSLTSSLSKEKDKKLRSAVSGDVIDKVSREVQSMQSLSKLFSERLTGLQASVQLSASALEAKLKDTDGRIATIDSQLTEIDQRLTSSSAALDKQLTTAIYLMIAALLVLFAGIRFLPENVALKIIETRSLVEVIGMAFLLLTVIILGTGNKLNAEAMGTLLGTIAGYIFGRKIAETSK